MREKKNDTFSAVEEALELCILEYPNFQVDKQGTKLKLWYLMLKDFSAEVVLHAVYHLLSLGRDFPPNSGHMRRQCSLFANGELYELSGATSWEHILDKIAKKTIELTDIEKKVLAQTKSIYDLGISKNIDADRARYIQAFEQFIAKRNLEWVTLPEVKKMVAGNMKTLPPSDKKNLPEKNTSSNDEIVTFEEAAKIFPELQELKGDIGKVIKGM